MTDSPEPPTPDCRLGMQPSANPMRAEALAPALPPEVEADLLAVYGALDALDEACARIGLPIPQGGSRYLAERLRAHIATLTRDCERMRAERDEARQEILVKVGNELNEACEVAAREARADALRWVLERAAEYSPIPGMTANMRTTIHAELARLDAGEGQPR